MLQNVQPDVQPGVTTFGDVSCFQSIAEAHGPGCRMVPSAEAARVEGHSGAVLHAVLSRALGWLGMPYSRRSPGFEGDQQKFHDVV